MHSLPLFHRLGGRKVILLAEGEAGEAKRRLLERAGAMIVDADDSEARLGFIALDEPEAAAQQLRAKGLLLNVTDRPDLCDFTVPSILQRGPVLVAVGTGGVSAGLAKALRLRLEALLPASLGLLAERLQQARGVMRQRFPEPGQRRRALDAALSEGGALDPLSAASADAVAGWLDGGEAGEGGTVEFSISSADPDDLTLRQARWLGAADFVAYEDRVSSEILARARADAVRLQIGAGERLSPRAGLTVIIRRG